MHAQDISSWLLHALIFFSSNIISILNTVPFWIACSLKFIFRAKLRYFEVSRKPKQSRQAFTRIKWRVSFPRLPASWNDPCDRRPTCCLHSFALDPFLLPHAYLIAQLFQCKNERGASRQVFIAATLSRLSFLCSYSYHPISRAVSYVVSLLRFLTRLIASGGLYLRKVVPLLSSTIIVIYRYR